VITAHHLDDVLEWWIFSCLHGEGKIIPYKVYNTHPYKARQSNHCIIRPFLLTDKHSFTKWALRKFDNPEPTWWMDDPSNDNTSFKRNYIRHNVVKHAEEINPGIRKVLRKKIKTHASYKRLGLEEL
jgi:tRNA(Ile)-lysidine synthase